MPIKYLIIDDESTERVRPYKEEIRNAVTGLSIETRQPISFEDQVKSLRGGDFDGFIFDLRLDQNPNAEGNKVSYTSQALAQELRSYMSGSTGRKIIKSVPIVLWSVANSIENLYDRDDTAQDLFDAVYQKDTDVKDEPSRVGAELISLATGYSKISEALSNRTTPPFELLLSIDGLEILDPRISDALRKEKRPSVHEVAQFINKQIIKPSGPLVDDRVLAARLGIDIDKSENWRNLLDIIEKTAGYKGVFSSAWKRFWWSAVEKWWDEKVDDGAQLQSLEASERVDLLITKTKLKKLTAASPVSENGGSKFWTICQATSRPLDTLDGIRMNEPDRAPWQDLSYLSLQSILDRTAKKERLYVHPLDKARFESLKAAQR